MPCPAGKPIKTYTAITETQHGIPLRELCPSATEVVADLQVAGFEAYIVGGGVRDLLLGKAPKDFDVATSATPEEVLEVFPRSRLIGRRFRLAHVRKKHALIEVATFRGPGSEDDDQQDRQNGRILRDNVWGTLEEDALRRDFTINALFLDPVGGELRDFVGGFEDLGRRRLRLIGDPELRYREDPVRLLRAARFVAKLGVEPDPATEEPISRLAPLLNDVPPARLFEELSKLFLTGHALRSLEALQRFGLSRTLFPVMPVGEGPGRVRMSPLLVNALRNTDERVRQDKPVTPAFLLAALLWEPVQSRAAEFAVARMAAPEALLQAAEAVIEQQSRRTSIPRRFSAVTKQIWVLQLRLARTRGRRWKRVLNEPKFRAAYDFLLLRGAEEPELQAACEFWTREQAGHVPAEVVDEEEPRRSRTRRTRTRRRGGARQRA